jgi:biotin operon repressor
MPTQKDRILDYLKSGQKLNRLLSWSRLGVLEAPARISELRSEGHPIKTQMRTVRNRFGEKVSIAEWSIESS